MCTSVSRNDRKQGQLPSYMCVCVCVCAYAGLHATIYIHTHSYAVMRCREVTSLRKAYEHMRMRMYMGVSMHTCTVNLHVDTWIYISARCLRLCAYTHHTRVRILACIHARRDAYSASCEHANTSYTHTICTCRDTHTFFQKIRNHSAQAVAAASVITILDKQHQLGLLVGS
jgi:hypothetical protein